jgi:hypothetical protein
MSELAGHDRHIRKHRAPTITDPSWSRPIVRVAPC